MSPAIFPAEKSNIIHPFDCFLASCARNRSPATLSFYRTRLRRFREMYNQREFGTLTPLEIDEHLAKAGAGLSDSTRHHNVVALERLQKFGLEHKLLDQAIGERQAGPIFLSPAGKAWCVPNLSRSYSRFRDMAGLPRNSVLYLARH